MVRSDNYWLSNASHATAVTPSDTASLDTAATQGLYVGVSGDVKVSTPDGDTVTFKAVPVGLLPVQVSRVYSTGTTATDIIALY